MSNKNKFNFWYSTKMALLDDNGGANCDWDTQTNWRSGCPQGSIGAILHIDDCRDYRQGDVFSSEFDGYGVMQHESGHALFGLRDEYDDAPDCTTSYLPIPTPYANIYDTLNGCQSNSTNPGDCDMFTTCGSDFFKSQPPDTIMACDNPGYPTEVGQWGPDANRQVLAILNDYEDPPADPYRKAIIATLHYDGVRVQVRRIDIVYGDSPERKLEWNQGLRFVFKESRNEVVNEFTIEDPRYIDYADPPGGELLTQTDFQIVFPFRNDIRAIEVSMMPSGGMLGKIDLAPAVWEFCDSHPDDPQCLSYDADGDGLADRADNCPDTYNPDQKDDDKDDYGAACECADTDPEINPGHIEYCGNMLDDNCNELIDLDDPDCDCECLGDLTGDGWLSPADVSNLVSYLLPFAGSYYWTDASTEPCGDMTRDGWLSPGDISSQVSLLLPHANDYYWLLCPR